MIADDSGFMRLMVKQMLQENEEIQVIDTAANGKEAFEKTQALRPDVLVLDMLMADYDGLYAIQNIMQHCPTPIILLTSLDTKQSNQVFEALQMGAIDFVNKPSGAFSSKIRNVQSELLEKIYQAKGVDVTKIKIKNIHTLQKSNHLPHSFGQNLAYQVILVGGSTGAPSGVEYIVNNLPANLPIPVIVAQHMPPQFISSFAQRLSKKCPMPITTSQEHKALKAGHIYLLDSESNWVLSRVASDEVVFQKTTQQFKAYNFPSIDALFSSAAAIYQQKTLGVILSGMGKDGTLGMGKIHQAQGMTLAQDQASSIIFGMPRAAEEEGFVQHLLPIKEIPMFMMSCLA